MSLAYFASLTNAPCVFGPSIFVVERIDSPKPTGQPNNQRGDVGSRQVKYRRITQNVGNEISLLLHGTSS